MLKLYTFRINPAKGKPFDWLELAIDEYSAWNLLCNYVRCAFPANDGTLVSLEKVQKYDFNEHTAV
jgi:hypothetical protein